MNTMVKKYITASLKGGKKKRTQVVKKYIDESSDEYESFVIDRINLADSEWNYEPSTGRKSTAIKRLTSNNINKCMMLNNFICMNSTKSKQIYYYLIIHGYVNLLQWRLEYRNFCILLDRVFLKIRRETI